MLLSLIPGIVCFVFVPLHRPVHRSWTGLEKCLHPTAYNGEAAYRLRQPNLEDFLFIKTMRNLAICVCALTVVVTCAAQQYPNRYDNFNADSIIQNERILLAYYKCVMEKGPCTKDGKNFKLYLPETLTTACERCSAKQKEIVRKLLLGIKAKSEARFFELLEKYDPSRANRAALFNFLITGN